MTNAQSLLRVRRDQERARRAALVEQALAGGRSGIPALMQGTRQGGRGRAQAFLAPESAPSGSPGETITVSRASQSIAAAGTAIEWDTVEAFPKAAGGIATGTTVPTSTLTQTLTDSYYVLSLEFEWDTYTGGGTVVVAQGGDTAGTVTATSGDHFVREFRLGHNVTPKAVQVTVSHTSGSAQTLVNARATLEKVDRIGALAIADVPEVVGWRFFETSSNTSQTVTLPDGAQVGQLCVVQLIHLRAFAAPLLQITDAGWFEENRTVFTDAGWSSRQVAQALWSKVLTADDITAGTFTYTTGSDGSGGAGGVAVLVQGASEIATLNPFSGVTNAAIDSDRTLIGASGDLLITVSRGASIIGWGGSRFFDADPATMLASFTGNTTEWPYTRIWTPGAETVNITAAGGSNHAYAGHLMKFG